MGIQDYIPRSRKGEERAGCQRLFSAIERARPKVHCFGHIHRESGAKLVTWRSKQQVEGFSTINHLTAIDNGRSSVIEKLSLLRSSKFDTDGDVVAREMKLRRYEEVRCVETSHCTGDQYCIQRGEQTLFVNAALMPADVDQGRVLQRPWQVDIELSKA